ncbi:unnamed protein product, partial [Rotaria sp. Silwood1]
KSIETVNNSSLLSSTSQKLNSKLVETIISNKNEENLSLINEKVNDINNKERKFISHHRSNTIPRHNRKKFVIKKKIYYQQYLIRMIIKKESFSTSSLQIVTYHCVFIAYQSYFNFFLLLF